MKKTLLAIAAAAAASCAFADNLAQDSGVFPGLQEVQNERSMKRAAKGDDDVKYAYVPESANIPTGTVTDTPPQPQGSAAYPPAEPAGGLGVPPSAQPDVAP